MEILKSIVVIVRITFDSLFINANSVPFVLPIQYKYIENQSYGGAPIDGGLSIIFVMFIYFVLARVYYKNKTE